jgi:hypothetical protein
VEYNPNNLMIVGGAALNIYDYKLQEFKERREIGGLEAYIKKMTSDIDIVWWPWAVKDKENKNVKGEIVVTSQSEAIKRLSEVFIEILSKKLTENNETLFEQIKTQLSKNMKLSSLTTHVVSKETFMAGVINIEIKLKINDKEIKISDIILHDSGASQRYDADGNEIRMLQDMKDDPVYCSPIQGQYNSISYLNVNGVDIALPNIKSFVDQQMLAFDNLVRTLQPKSLINYKRVQFIKELLSNFKVNNTKNLTDLKEVFGTDNIEFPKLTVFNINNRVDVSIIKENSKIAQLCALLSNTNDSIISDLCKKRLQLLNELNEYKTKELVRLGMNSALYLKEYQALKGQHSLSNIRRDYHDLYRKVENKRLKLFHSTPINVLKYKIKQNDSPDEDVIEAERLKKEYSKIVESTRYTPKPLPQSISRGYSTGYAPALTGYSSIGYDQSSYVPTGYDSSSYPTAVYTPSGYSTQQYQQPAYIDAMGRPVYVDPLTGQYIVWAQEYGRYIYVTQPMTSYSDETSFQGSPRKYRKKGGRTKRNRNHRNITRKNI